MFHGRISLNSAAASEFCDWVQVGINLYIPHRKYQVKRHLSPWSWLLACATAIAHRNHLFRFCRQNKSSESKVKFTKLVIVAESITSQKLGSRDFWGIANIIDRGKAAVTLYSMVNRCCHLDLIKQGISLPAFPSRTNLKLHNIFLTPKMVKKVITNLDLSKASGLDCISVVVLKNCEPEISYILAKLFNRCLIQSYFRDCWKVSSVVPLFKDVGERSTAKSYHPVSLFSVVSKVFEKLVNNRIVDHLEKCGLFSDF